MSESSSRPTAYRILTPPEWHKIPLEDADRRHRSIRSLVNQQFRGHDNLVSQRRQLEAWLDRSTADAAEIGGVETYVSTLTVAGIPLAATLTVSLMRWDSGSSAAVLSDLAESLRSSRDPQEIVESSAVEALPVGPAVRRVAVLNRSGLPEEAGESRASFVVQWHIEVPQSPGSLLTMTFSSPLLPLQGPLEGLFDSVASTLTWVSVTE